MSKSRKPRYLSGPALRKARLDAGLSQAQVAERAGATQAQVSGWEREHTGCQIGMLHRLATAVGVTAATLMLPESDDADEAEPAGAAA